MTTAEFDGHANWSFALGAGVACQPNFWGSVQHTSFLCRRSGPEAVGIALKLFKEPLLVAMGSS